MDHVARKAIDVRIRVSTATAHAHSSVTELLAGSALAPFPSDWPLGETLSLTPPAALPVVRRLTAAALRAIPGFATELGLSLRQTAPQLTWRQTYGSHEVEAGFLENYAWTELIGLWGWLRSEQLACGLLLLGPQTRYPLHWHDAHEIYLPLAGTASWQKDDGAWTAYDQRAREQGAARHANHRRSAARVVSKAPGPLAQKSQLEVLP